MAKKKGKILYNHGNQTKIHGNKAIEPLYITNTLTQYTVPREDLPDELDDAHTQAAKQRVDENDK